MLFKTWIVTPPWRNNDLNFLFSTWLTSGQYVTRISCPAIVGWKLNPNSSLAQTVVYFSGVSQAVVHIPPPSTAGST